MSWEGVNCGSDFTNSSDAMTNLIDNVTWTYSYAEILDSQINPSIQKTYFDRAIEHIDAVIEGYTKDFAKAGIRLSDLAQNAQGSIQQFDSQWIRFQFDSSKKLQNSDEALSFHASQTVRGSLWSVSAYAANQNFTVEMNSAQVEIKGELLRVSIQRPWFRPLLFRNDQYVSILLLPNIILNV